MILVDDTTVPRIQSTATFIERLPTLAEGVTYPIQQIILRYLVDSRGCPLCKAVPGWMCVTLGSQNLRRTHEARLDVGERELQLVVEWALLEYARRIAEES